MVDLGAQARELLATMLNSGLGQFALVGLGLFAAIGLAYLAVYTGALAAFGALVDQAVGGASRRRARDRRGLSTARHAGRLWCPNCRSINSGLDNACYSCGVPVSTGIPLGHVPGGPPADPLTLPADLPTADALEERWRRANGLLASALTGGVVLALVSLLAGASPLLVLVVVALLLGSRVLLVADPGRLPAPSALSGIARYEALLVVLAVMALTGSTLPPVVAIALLVVFGTAAFLMGRARTN